MLSRIPQPAFLPSLPLTRTTTISRKSASLSVTPPSPARTSRTRRPFHASVETSEVHESWHVYSKPGNKCVICAGEGTTKCLYCFGEGVVRVGPEVARDTISCPHCEGAGKETCVRCDGSGVRPDTRFDAVRGVTVRNLTNEEVCSLPLEGFGIGGEEEKQETERETERKTERETASNGVAII